jgi:large subunit ribosomal protein L22
MGKPNHPRVLGDHEAKAINAIVRISPQKLNLLAQMIRGKRVERARAELQFSPKRAAIIVKKVLESAIANAENNHGLDVDSLIVSEAFVGKRMVMKRFHPRARGRAGKIEKFFSQITVVVREVDDAVGTKKWRGSKRGANATAASAKSAKSAASQATSAGAGE